MSSNESRERLDRALVTRRLIQTRSQAEQEITFGNVAVNGRIVTKTSFLVSPGDKLRLIRKNPYVSRAGLKLASVARSLGLRFDGAVVLDIGSSTGGFTDYALQHGASHVIAVDVGTNQLHPKLRADRRVELHEQTDIRDFATDRTIDIVVIDVSFISLREILPAVRRIAPGAVIAAMCKPQFEADKGQVSGGVVKNNAKRRNILHDFEDWLRGNGFVIRDKSDSDVSGEKGNVERFYLITNTI